MKWLAFGIFLLVGVPSMTALSAWSRKGRAILIALLVASTVVKVSINICSLEDYRGPDRGFEISLTDLIATSLGAGLLLTQWRRVKWLPVNLGLYVIYVVVAMLSVAEAPDQQLALFTVFKWTKTIILYWSVFNCFWCDWPMGGAVAGLIAAGGIETVVAVKQKYLHGYYRINGTFDHSNTIPAYFLVVIPVLLCWLLAGNRSTRVKVIGVLAVLGMCFVIAATMSRAGVALLGLTIVSVIVYSLIKAPSFSKFAFAGMFGCVCMIGALKAADSFIDRFKNAPESSEEARDEFNIAADKMARDNVLGVGVNCFSRVLTDDDRYRDSIEVMKDEEHAGVCHHIYRLTAAEMGYVGLGLFLVMILRFQWASAKYAFQAYGQESFVLFGVLVGCSALHAVGLLEWVFRVTPVWNLFWLTSALAAATSLRLAHGLRSGVAT